MKLYIGNYIVICIYICICINIYVLIIWFAQNYIYIYMYIFHLHIYYILKNIKFNQKFLIILYFFQSSVSDLQALESHYFQMAII